MFETRSIKAFTDEDLLLAYRKKDDPRLLEELLGRYIRFVFLVCMKYMRNEEQSKDLSMQVFEKVIADLPRFEIHHFKSWLHVVAKNTCLMHLRSQKGVHEIRLDQIKEPETFVKNDTLLHHEYDNNRELRLSQLEEAIATLEDGQQQCIRLFYLDEKSYSEVAGLTGYDLNQVKSFIQNGKRNLRNMLVSNGNVLLSIFISLYYNKML